MSSQLRHVSTIGKNLLSSNISSTCLHNMVNGPLAAEIVSLVWGTAGNFNGFRVLAALLHDTLVVGVSQSAALNRGRHLYSAGRPSRWALAHISSMFLIWRSGNALVTINVVARRWARLVLGWVTACGGVRVSRCTTDRRTTARSCVDVRVSTRRPQLFSVPHCLAIRCLRATTATTPTVIFLIVVVVVEVAVVTAAAAAVNRRFVYRFITSSRMA